MFIPAILAALTRNRRRKSIPRYDDESNEFVVARYPLQMDKAVNTPESFLKQRKKKERPEWKKYWPQTPQPRNHHRPDFYKRKPGMYSTWQDPDFGSYSGPLNTSSLYHLADDGIRVKSDREKMMRHLKTPYVEMPAYATYSPQLGAMDLAVSRQQDRMQQLHRRDASTRISFFGDKEDQAYRRAKHIEDTKRQQALMRIGSDVEKQQQYEKKLYNTIDAKRKINQSFRNSFYQKELDHLNRQQAHADWLQDRRNKIERQHVDRIVEKQKLEESRQLGRQYRQARHHADTVRRYHESETKKST